MKKYKQLTLMSSLVGKNEQIEVPSMGITYNHDFVYNLMKDKLKTNNTWNERGFYSRKSIPPALRIYFKLKSNPDVKAAYDYALQHGFVYYNTNTRNTHFFKMGNAYVAYTPGRKLWSLHFEKSFEHPRLRKTAGYNRIKNERYQFEFDELHLAVEAIKRLNNPTHTYEDIKKYISTIEFTDQQKVELMKLILS